MSKQVTRKKPKTMAKVQGRWFKLATYPKRVIVCPLCRLPETTDEYIAECKCWDNRNEETNE